MNRREFTKSMAAASVAPLVPLPATATTATASVAPNFSAFSYMWSAHYARLNGACSPEMLAGRFAFNDEVAAEINHRLVKNGIISAPNALGISRAMEPFQDSVKSVGAAANPETAGKNSDLKDSLKKKLQEVLEEEEVTEQPEEESIPKTNPEPDQDV